MDANLHVVDDMIKDDNQYKNHAIEKRILEEAQANDLLLMAQTLASAQFDHHQRSAHRAMRKEQWEAEQRNIEKERKERGYIRSFFIRAMLADKDPDGRTFAFIGRRSRDA